MNDYEGMSAELRRELRRELDREFPDGWDIALTRADADKLFAGGITAVNAHGEAWLDHDRYLTEEEAAACLKIVKEWIERKAGPEWDPRLYRPGHEGDFWNISLEGAQDDWPWLMSQDESVTWPKGVYVEAGASWYLCLIRDNG